MLERESLRHSKLIERLEQITESTANATTEEVKEKPSEEGAKSDEKSLPKAPLLSEEIVSEA